jgi:poly(A) polymerase Pap1
LKESIAKLTAQNTELAVQLASANSQVKSIAEKALESASGTRTLAEVTSLVQNRQDNGAPRGKS